MIHFEKKMKKNNKYILTCKKKKIYKKYKN